MNKYILPIAIFTLMAGTILTSCGETSKKDVKSAKENMTEAGHDLKQAGKDAQLELKNKMQTDWNNFKKESEKTIASAEEQIKAQREKISKASKSEQEKWGKKLDKLEMKNKEFRERLNKRERKINDNLIEFNDTAVAKEKEYEREFKHDMDELGTAMKDLFKNNVE